MSVLGASLELHRRVFPGRTQFSMANDPQPPGEDPWATLAHEAEILGGLIRDEQVEERDAKARALRDSLHRAFPSHKIFVRADPNSWPRVAEDLEGLVTAIRDSSARQQIDERAFALSHALAAALTKPRRFIRRT